jgi:hypothetical protein
MGLGRTHYQFMKWYLLFLGGTIRFNMTLKKALAEKN